MPHPKTIWSIPLSDEFSITDQPAENSPSNRSFRFVEEQTKPSRIHSVERNVICSLTNFAEHHQGEFKPSSLPSEHDSLHPPTSEQIDLEASCIKDAVKDVRGPRRELTSESLPTIPNRPASSRTITCLDSLE
ncbi:hypothetical protein CDAR_424201 [Caerostris darwini]|uniref:Uncharacterized protein n=1 Tax=Caerostris darwini TaxID=1538125 RepID=A0AAV4T231_9ARAC|nr:hypothetical protein CDAR_424201 [Caerostris darwini]